jgi:hypothetical protein
MTVKLEHFTTVEFCECTNLYWFGTMKVRVQVTAANAPTSM